MSLKSIRESYSKLLKVFDAAGLKLNESQKSDLDTFIIALESNMSEQRKTAIRMTKKAVESKMEKQYRSIFESIMKNTAENSELAAKIQDKITQINESKKIANKVNDYLELYVESVLPKKTIIDYDRMKKLETIHESLKDALLVNDDEVSAKKAQLEKAYKTQKSKLETEVAKMQVKLNESMAKTQKMKKEVDKYKAMQLLESKTKDLPTFEAKKIKKLLSESSVEEIERKFKRVLESVKKDEKAAASECEATLEAEIDKIVEDDVEENDMIKGRPHNGHIVEDDISDETDESEEEFETTESIKTNEDGDVELDEEDVIDKDAINEMCRLCKDIY